MGFGINASPGCATWQHSLASPLGFIQQKKDLACNIVMSCHRSERRDRDRYGGARAKHRWWRRGMTHTVSSGTRQAGEMERE